MYFVCRGMWFLTGGDFAFRGHLAMSGDSFSCHSQSRGVTGIERVGPRDTAIHHTMIRTAPKRRNYQAKISTVARFRSLCIAGT